MTPKNLAETLHLHGLWLINNPNGKQADLREADLYGADLTGADLRGANLYGANLYGANLYGADLCWANLRGAYLADADLYGAELCGAKLRGADLRRADLRRANLYGVSLRWANLRGANLTEADLRGADLRGATLTGADLCEADLYGAKLTGAYLTEAEGLPAAPVIPNIDAAILAAIAAGGKLNMGAWHTCETTHCRAGWAIHLAGAKGAKLERSYGSSVAGALIYAASRPGVVPDFYSSNEAAMADMMKHAEGMSQ